MNKVSTEIASNPILFEDGVALPHDPNGLSTDPQTMWFSIVRAQRWGAARVLGQEVDGLQLSEPYFEPAQYEDVAAKIDHADEQRHGTERYTAARNTGSLAGFLGVKQKNLLDELAKKSVLDVGSGDGLVGNELRRHGKTRVIEIDFSEAAFQAAEPIANNRGTRIVGDGTVLPFSDGAFDAVTSMFSTSVHADTVRSRLQGFTEAVRVTKRGGRIFMAPLFSNMMLRQDRWARIEAADQASKLDLTQQEMDEYRQGEQQQAAIDYALHGLLGELMANRTISLTPVLMFEKHEKYSKDAISAIIDVNKPLTKDQAKELIEKQAATFDKPSS